MHQELIRSMTEERIQSADGTSLFVRSWLPEQPARAIVIVVHGFNSHSGYYLWTADQLVASGLGVYALDLRGRGRSDGERYYIESFAEYLQDVHALVTLARTRHPDLRLFVLGHSAGGVISSAYCLEHQTELAGLICESFAFRVFAPDLALSLLKGISHVAPHVHVLRLNIDDFSRDPVVVRTMKDDPFVGDEVQPTLTVAEMVRADERLERDFPRFRLPLLILHGTTDKVTRAEGSEKFHAEAGSADKTLKLYDGHAHDLLNDVGKEGVIADVTAWINARL
jgi:alpha-beta hydrolase superfamily lysophospholipase